MSFFLIFDFALKPLKSMKKINIGTLDSTN